MEFCSSTTATHRTFFPSKPAAAFFFLLLVHFQLLIILSPSREFTSPHSQHRPTEFVHPKFLPCEKVVSRFVASAAPATVDNSVADKLPADIRVTETPEPDSRVRLSVEVLAAVSDDCYRGVLKELMKRSKVPGFRPGRLFPEISLLVMLERKLLRRL